MVLIINGNYHYYSNKSPIKKYHCSVKFYCLGTIELHDLGEVLLGTHDVLDQLGKEIMQRSKRRCLACS